MFHPAGIKAPWSSKRLVIRFLCATIPCVSDRLRSAHRTIVRDRGGPITRPLFTPAGRRYDSTVCKQEPRFQKEPVPYKAIVAHEPCLRVAALSLIDCTKGPSIAIPAHNRTTHDGYALRLLPESLAGQRLHDRSHGHPIMGRNIPDPLNSMEPAFGLAVQNNFPMANIPKIETVIRRQKI